MVETLWDKLQREVTFSDVRRWLKGSGAPGAQSAGRDADVDKLLRDAEVDAQRRGVPLVEVLRERGFDIPEDAAPTEATGSQEEVRQSMMRSLAWESVSGPDGVSPTLELQALHPVTRIAWPEGPFADEERARIEATLRDATILERVRLLGGLEDSVIAPLRVLPDGVALHDAVLHVGLSGERLLEAADAQPGALPNTHASAWLDELFMEDLVPYRLVRMGQKAVEEGEATTLFGWLLAHDDVDASLLLGFVAGKARLRFFTGAVQDSVAADVALLPWVEAFEMVPVEDVDEGPLVFAAPFVLPASLLGRLSEVMEGRETEAVLALPTAVDTWRVSWLQATREARTSQVRPPQSAAPLLALPKAAVGRLQPEQTELLESAAATGTAIELVRAIFEVALSSRATDIHLEPVGQQSRVRYRIDGVCIEALRLPREVFGETLARIKVLADLDVTERRRPQDGHVRFVVGKRPLDMRISTLPTRRGEKMAVRLVDAGHVVLSLPELGLLPAELERIRAVASRPYGLILATGPVGSGKTTTLYACLSEVDRTSTHVVSIEDPVEMELDGANQVEVNRTIGVDFASGLRALLRQDPDVVLVGEIRDVETAKIGVRAAMTGRLVYSTLHANTAAAAVTTLRNFGIEDFMVAAALQGVVAQRLVRRVCEHCAEPIVLTDEEREVLGLEVIPEGFAPRRGAGCDHCAMTGYHGRLGVFEVLAIDDALRDMILAGASHREMEVYARASGMESLESALLAAIGRGETTPEERVRILGRS